MRPHRELFMRRSYTCYRLLYLSTLRIDNQLTRLGIIISDDSNHESVYKRYKRETDTKNNIQNEQNAMQIIENSFDARVKTVLLMKYRWNFMENDWILSIFRDPWLRKSIPIDISALAIVLFALLQVITQKRKRSTSYYLWAYISYLTFECDSRCCASVWRAWIRVSYVHMRVLTIFRW